MKKRKFLWALMPAVLMLTGCGNTTEKVELPEISTVEKTGTDGTTDTYTITYSDGSTKTFTMPAKVDPNKPNYDTTNATVTRDALKDIQGRIDLDGTLTIFAGDETAQGTDTTIDVTFTEDAYYYSSVDDLGQENTGNIFKVGGNAVIAGVNLQNELVFTAMTDDDGNVSPWSEYENPFKDLTIYDFVAVEGEAGTFELRLDIPHVKEMAIEMTARISNYLFPDLASFDFKLTNGEISEVTFETPTFESYFGTERYVGSFKVVASGSEVEDLTYPEVLPTLAEHETLLTALTEINTSPLKVKYEQLDKMSSDETWEEAYLSYDNECYFDKTAYYSYDNVYGVGYGAIVKDGNTYEVDYDSETDVYTRSFYPTLDSEGNAMTDLTSVRGNFLIAAPEHFTVIDDKHFEITGIYAGTVAYYFDVMGNPFSASMTKVTVTLNDDYKVSEITFTDELFTLVTMTFEQIGGTLEMPFTEEDLVIEADPFTSLIHTYEYTDEAGDSHSVVVNSLTDIKVDGEAAENIAFDGDSEVAFEVGDYTYSINYFSYSSKYYTLSIEGPNDFYEYYSSASYDGSLTVK